MLKSMNESRTAKTIKNAKYNLFFLIINVLIAFFSRKIFLDCLGTQFLGLSSTLSSLLGFLNLAELGIGTAIGVSLYKPLAENNRESINEIVSVLGFYYRFIGLFILCGGVVISLFLPLMFKGEEISLFVIYSAFYAFLLSTFISYYFNYRQVLLGADQKRYVVTKYLHTANVVKLLLQMAMASYTSNVYVWIVIELSFAILACWILNKKIDKTYLWLVSDTARGKRVRNNYPNIKTYTRQLFIQKVASFAANQISPLFIYSYVSLDMVAYSTNYTTLLSKLTMFTNSLLASTDASVGNLIASNDKKKILDVYHEMFSTYFFMAAFFSYMLFFMTEPFIGLWLGEQYELGEIVLLLYIANFFLCHYMGATWQFLYGYGLFKDVWASISEMVLYLFCAFLGGYLWGFEGILLATVISKYVIHAVWKPYFLFTEGFHEPIIEYIKLFIKHCCVFAAIVLICEPIRRLIIMECTSWYVWICNAMITMFIFLVASAMILYFTIPQYKSVVQKLRFSFKR